MSYNKLQKLSDNIEAIRLAFEIEKGKILTDADKTQLRKYSGFGGLKFVLYPEGPKERWRKSDHPYYEKLQELWKLLWENTKDETEYRRYVGSIKNSVLTSFYTPEPIVKAISSSMKETGMKIERFLDPSSGNGIFIDKFQEDHSGIHATCFEKDLITGKVLLALHQEADVYIDGFETIESSLSGTFDVSASNIPFGDVKVFDPLFSGSTAPEAYKIASQSIHNYFFMKAMSEVRDGGVVAFITSRGVLDSEKSRPVRQALVESANLVSVVRLPDGMFRDEAGTSVGSDLIILQRNDNKQALTSRDHLFISLKPSSVAGDIFVNGLLAQGDNAVYTDIVVGTDPYGKKAVVYKYDKSIDELGQELHIKIKNNFAVSLDKALYGKGFKKEERKQDMSADSQSPKSSHAVQLTLFDLFDEVEEQTSVFAPRPYTGTILGHYRNGIFVRDNEQIGVLSEVSRSGAVFTPLDRDMEPYQRSVLSQYILVRDSYEDLYRTEATLRECQDNLRKVLNNVYDEFVNRFGFMNSRKNSSIIYMDLLGRDTVTLENRSADGKTFKKADIFSHPVSFSLEENKEVSSATDALSASLNRYGNVNLPYMSEISGITIADLKKELSNRIYYNPAIGQGDSAYEISDKFLSGNIIEKLEALENYTPDNQYESDEVARSRAALEEVKPTPIAFEDLDFNFGERWMPKEFFSEFASQLFDVKVTIEFAPRLDEFIVRHDGFSHKADEEFAVTGETKTYDGYTLLRHALYNTVPAIQKVIGYTPEGNSIMGPDHEKIQLAASKIEQIRDEFINWVNRHTEEWKKELADTYNRKFNCFVRAKYDGSHQTFPDLDLKGLSDSKYKISNIYQSQKDCVWMLLQNGGGICDHEVGTGKTLIMCMTAHEMKRLGLAHKPVIIGMKANVAEIAATYQTAYPKDRILYASAKDFKDRENFFNRMKNNDYDCIIMSHDQFSMIPQSPEIQKTVMEEELYALEEALEVYRRNGGTINSKILYGLEKRKENLLVQLQKINSRLADRADNVVDFKTMGIDHILVDESQVFKNLAFTTRDNRVSGLGDPKGSQRARNLQYAIRTIQQRTGKDLGATFLSGTTISNSLTELYLLFKYLRPSAMAKQNINSFDAWAAVFARKSRDYEINVAGSVVMKERFRRFIKVPELATFYNEITDYRTANDVGLDRPDMSVRLVNLEPTDAHKDFFHRLLQFAQRGIGSLVFRADLSDNEMKAKMLLVTNMGKKASLSPKLVNMDYSEGDNTKIGVAARNIAEYYRRYDEHKGTQFVFCDLSTPKKDEWNAYQELKDRLVNQYDIPAEEIGFIQDAGTERKKQEYIAKMNRGEIRVMFGSTSMLGTGVNAQEKAVAVHHLDLPWRPSDMEQRNGRARRKGNEVARLFANNNVDCFVYAVERSLDSYNFYLLQAKSEFIRQMKIGSLAKRSFDQGGEDEDSGMPFAEYVAITSGNNDLLDRAKLEKRILGLESERKAFQTEQHRVERKLSNSRTELVQSEEILSKLKEDFQTLESNSEKDTEGKYINALELNGLSGSYSEEEKGSYLQEQVRRLITEEVEIGHIFGFPIVMRPKDSYYEGKRIGNQVFVKGNLTYSHSEGFVNMSSRVAAAMYALTAITKIPSLIERYEDNIARCKQDIPELERISGKCWNKADLLSELKQQLSALDRKIQQDIEVKTLEDESQKEETPFKIEQDSWGRQPWHLTFKVSDYPFISLSDAKSIGENLHGFFHTYLGVMEGHFRHQYGAQAAIKELSKLNADRRNDVIWLKEMARHSEDRILRVSAAYQLRKQGFDPLGDVLSVSEKSDRMTVVALADYSDVRLLAHGVKDGHQRSIDAAASAMARVIQSMPESGNAILVPMPGHEGDAMKMSMLTKCIEKLTGIESVEVLMGAYRQDLYQWKKDHPDEVLPEVFFMQDESLRSKFEFKTPIVIDNVFDTGHTAWAAMSALSNTPILVTLGTTGNHTIEGHNFDVKVAAQGLRFINEARPDGVGFSGLSQAYFDILLKNANSSPSDYGITNNMHHARIELRLAGYDYHTGRPNFEVSSIVKRWEYAKEDVLISTMKDIMEKVANGRLFTYFEKKHLPQEKVNTLIEKMKESFAAINGTSIDDRWIDPIRNIFINYEVMKMDAIQAIQKERTKIGKDVSSKRSQQWEKVAHISAEDSKAVLDMLYSRGTDEVRSIIFQAEKDHQLLKAPNGEPTHLSPVQWVYTRTESFRNFFGSSKVLNEDMEPMILYHGTVNHDFVTFRNEGDGIYFTPDKASAQSYGIDANPYQVFVKMNNPMEIDFDGDADTKENNQHYSLTEEYKNAVKMEYDGVIAHNTYDGENEMDQYVVHNPEDIMLADDATLLERMDIRFTEEEQRSGNLRMQKGLENSNILKYELSQAVFEPASMSMKTEVDYQVDFGIGKDITKVIPISVLRQISEDNNGELFVLSHQNNRIMGVFTTQALAQNFAESVCKEYEERSFAADKVVRDRLISLFKEKGNIKVVTDREQVQSILSSIQQRKEDARCFKTSDGVSVYGFTHNDTIYIDPKIATAETPLHEYTHLWASAMRQNNPGEWQNIVSLMKECESLWTAVKQDYPELKDDNALAEEVLAHYSGHRGAEKLREAYFEGLEVSHTFFERVCIALEKLWHFVADFLHIHYESKEQVADQILKDALSGVNPLQYQNNAGRYYSEIELAHNLKLYLANSEHEMNLPDDLQRIYYEYEALAEEYMSAVKSPLVAPSDKKEIKESFTTARRRFGEALSTYFGVENLSDMVQMHRRYEDLAKKYSTAKAIYTALFLENKESLVTKLSPVHPNVYGDHITTSFYPESVNLLELGGSTSLHIKGRLTTDKVDVLLLEESFEELYAKGIFDAIDGNKGVKTRADIPHITFSTAEGVSPAESNVAIKDYFELLEERWRHESSIVPSELSLTVFDKFMHSLGIDTRKMKTVIADRKHQDWDTDIINSKLSAYTYTPLDIQVNVRNGAYIKGGNVIFSPEDYEALKFQKGIRTVNKVSWQGIMNVYSSSRYLPIRALSYGVKQGDPEAIEEASIILTKLVERVPGYKNAVLIPIPNRGGSAVNTLELANRISKELHLPVADILTGKPHKPLYNRKENKGNDGLRLLRFDTKGDIPSGKGFILIDNVLDTGTTAMSAMRTLGENTSVVVLGSTTNSRKYNYPISIHVSPVVTDHLSKSKVEFIRQYMMGYYTDKCSREGISVELKDIIRAGELQNWQGIFATAKKMETAIYSKFQLDEIERNSRMSYGIYEVLSSIMKAESLNRLSRDIRAVLKESCMNPQAEGWMFNAKDLKNHPMTITIPIGKDQLPLMVRNNMPLDIVRITDAEFNNVVLQLSNWGNTSILATYLHQLGKIEERGKLKDMLLLPLENDDKIWACSYKLSVSPDNGVTLSLGNNLGDVISGKTVPLESVREEYKDKVIDAVMIAVGLAGEKKMFRENYVVDSYKRIDELESGKKVELSQVTQSQDVKPIKNTIMDEKKEKNEERQNVVLQEASAQNEQNAQKSKFKPNERWENIDYSKYRFPEGVDVKGVNVFKSSVFDPERQTSVNRYKITAIINGKKLFATMYHNDVSAFFERDINGNLTKRVSALTLAAKYFSKAYMNNETAAEGQSQEVHSAQEVDQEGVRKPQGAKQELKSLGEFEIPVYAIGYLSNGADALDGLEEEDVLAVTNFEQSLPANYVIKWPENVDAAKYFSSQPSFGAASDVVKVEIFQVQEAQAVSQVETPQHPKENPEEQKFSCILILKDDEKKSALYAKDENGRPFVVYAIPEDVDCFFNAYNNASVKRQEVHVELAKKYYEILKAEPSMSAEAAIFKSKASAEDLARISLPNVFRTKEKVVDGVQIPSRTMIKATIDGTPQKAREITEDQMRNTFLAPDLQDYKIHLAAKVYSDILHPEQKEAVGEAEEASQETEKSQEESEKVNVSIQANLLTKALEGAAEKDGVWMNEGGKEAPTILSGKSPISAFNSMVMSLYSDQNGYKTNVYTSFATAKRNGYSVRSGQSAVPFNWFEWDRYVNRFSPSDIIDKKTYEALPAEEKEMYKLAIHKDVQRIFNIDQTLMKQQKPEIYKGYTSNQYSKEQAFRQLVADIKAAAESFPKDVIKFESADTPTAAEFYINIKTEKGEGFFVRYEKEPSSIQYYELTHVGEGYQELTAADWKEKITATIDSLKQTYPEADLHPLLRQYQDMKSNYPDSIIFIRTGDSYETYKDDAVKASSILGITLTESEVRKDAEGKSLVLAAFPYHALETYLPRLVRAGERVAICEPLENPQMQKYGAASSIYEKLDKITSELLKVGAETTRVAPTHFKDGVLTIDIRRNSEPGKEMETALGRTNELFRAVAAYTFAEDKLDIGAKSKMLPEDVEKYTKLIQELGAGVLMSRQGYPARLSSEGRELVPFWTRELRENPSLIDKIENDVNNVVKAVNDIMNGRGASIDYNRMRGDKATAMLPSDYSIVSMINRQPSLAEKNMVIIKDDKEKSVDVILPEGASLQMGEDIKGMNKNRIALALTKAGYDGEKISWYNAHGGLALKQPNEYFEGKSVEVVRLKQYTLIPISTIDVSDELKHSGQPVFDKVQMVRDDEGHWALYVAPQKDYGEAFAIYPEPRDIKRFFETLKTDQASSVAQELGQKYLAIVNQHPELKATFMMPAISDEQLLSRITRVDITQNKNKENSIVMWATIDGKTQPPIELTREQYQRFFLVSNQEAYKLALASQLFYDKLNVNVGSEAREEQVRSQEGAKQANLAEAQNPEEEKTQEAEKDQDESRSRGMRM